MAVAIYTCIVKFFSIDLWDFTDSLKPKALVVTGQFKAFYDDDDDDDDKAGSQFAVQL